MLHTYNWTLDERKRRKEFVLKQSLLESVRDYPAQERRRSREERALRTRMRPYARHHAEAPHEQLQPRLQPCGTQATTCALRLQPCRT